MEIDMIKGGSAWAISYSLRWIAHRIINNIDTNTVKSNINKLNKISELTYVQKEFDLVEIILKEAIPALIGLAGLCVGITSISENGPIATSSFVFGISHLIEAYSFHKRFNKPLKGA